MMSSRAVLTPMASSSQTTGCDEEQDHAAGHDGAQRQRLDSE
jgi:hypothetical protein